MWKALSAEDRQYWDDKAAKEKEIYMAEKLAYTGLWYVPHKRTKKVRSLWIVPKFEWITKLSFKYIDLLSSPVAKFR